MHVYRFTTTSKMNTILLQHDINSVLDLSLTEPPSLLALSVPPGRAIAQAVSRRPPTAAALVRARAR
jgi:hypothetical protein